MNVYEKALVLHEELAGKIDICPTCELKSKEDLALAYSPGVAEPCRRIHANKHDAYKYTWKGNIVAVVSDGTAVLGLGDIGPEAGLPVMEGKAVLFKQFGGVNAIPIMLDTKDPDEIVNIVKKIAPTFGGINLEDISAPRCVEIERRLKEELDIPVFHDDQHGTAIVTIAGLINALKLVNKKPEDCKVVISGAGAAGSSIIKMMVDFGIKEIYAFNSKGVLNRKHNEKYNFLTKEIAEITNPKQIDCTLREAMQGADIFLGVSMPGLVDEDMVRSMNHDAIVFAMANPDPEIPYENAKAAGARIVGTGRSDYPNQVNNVLAFPGLFKGALSVRASKITEEMKMAAAVGIAKIAEEDGLSDDYVIPSAFNPRVADIVSAEVAKKAIEQGLNRI
ncbi:MAG: malic enzyme-like NAD(P)-binding protein [Eubacteriales bacterium]|nr:malic enzyme-like NAD(P)-binding protein [Eubacteriales bacterium]